MLRWRGFLDSDLGKDLMAKARALECAKALQACQADPNNPFVVKPDRAAGFSDAINWFQSLAFISVESAAQSQQFEPRNSRSESPVNEPAYA
jgi:hypothetical protein